MEGFSRTSEKNRDGGNDPDSRDTGKGTSSSEVDNSDNAPEDNVTVPEHESSKVELHEITEKSRVATGLEDHPGGVTDAIPIPSARSSKEIKVGATSGSPDMRSDRDSSERKIELSSPSTTETSTSSTGKTKSFPRILGGVRREREISREMLDTIADMPQRPLEISVSMQTDASWIHDHVYKREPPLTAPKETQKEIPPENDIYAVIPQDLSCLDILCDTEFREDFLKLFQESLQTISSVGPPTILAYRPESSRADIHIEEQKPMIANDFTFSPDLLFSLLLLFSSIVQKETPETCEFCGRPLIYFPSFESLEHIAEWGDQCRDLHEFIVSEKNRYPKKMEMIDIAPHKAHGSQADRERAKERARQRLRERQMAKQIAFMAVEAEKSAFPMHIPEYNKQLKTISFFLSQETPSSARIYPPVIKEAEIVDNTYSISCCDFTIAGGKLVKNQFIQQYYKNGVKFLTMFPDGTAQILINITVRGGHYSDQAGNKVKTWIWPNNLQKHNPRVSFKPIFLSLNLNVGVRILGQDKIAISFLAMGKQAKINVGTKVKPLAEHLPWPKYIAEDDLLLFANRLKILRIFAKLNGYLDFPASDWWTKLELPSFLLKQTSKLIYLCKECEIDCALDKLIMAKLNSPV
ncbi:hypothetical protein Chor_014348 [Crotalus horridus]